MAKLAIYIDVSPCRAWRYPVFRLCIVYDASRVSKLKHGSICECNTHGRFFPVVFRPSESPPLFSDEESEISSKQVTFKIRTATNLIFLEWSSLRIVAYCCGRRRHYSLLSVETTLIAHSNHDFFVSPKPRKEEGLTKPAPKSITAQEVGHRNVAECRKVRVEYV